MLILSPYVTPCWDMLATLFDEAITRAYITAAIDNRAMTTTTLFVVIWHI